MSAAVAPCLYATSLDLDLPSIRAALEQPAAVALSAPSVPPCSPLAACSSSSRSTLVLSLTKRLRSMQRLLNATQAQPQPQAAAGVLPSASASAPQTAEAGGCSDDAADCDAEADKENAGGAGVDGERRAQQKGGSSSSGGGRRRSRRWREARERELAALRQAVAALEADRERLRLEVASLQLRLTEGELRLQAERDAACLRYDAVIQEKDDELEEMRAIMEAAAAGSSRPEQQPGQSRQSEQPAPGSAAAPPAYPTLTPNSSPLLSAGSARLQTLDDTQDIVIAQPQPAAASVADAAAAAPLPPRTPARPPAARRQLAAVPAFSPSPASPPAAASCSPSVASAWQAYVERKGLQRERELQSLPITSPSTPDSKRRKILSPASGQAEGSGSGAAPAAAAASSPASAAETSAPAAVRVLAFDSERCGSGSECPAQLQQAGAGEGAASAVCLSAAEARRLSSELRRLRGCLELRTDWSLRVKAMNSIEELSREPLLGRWPDWGRELELLRPALLEQLADLRSSIVREACRLLVALAESGRLQFEREVEAFFPALYRGLYVTIRVIRESCDACIAAIVERLRSPRCCLPALLAGCHDIHAVVRERCGRYLQLLLAQAPASELEPFLAELSSCVVRCMQDGDHSTRAAFRVLFRSFSLLFPSRAQALHHELPAAVQRTLDTERKQQQTAGDRDRRSGSSKQTQGSSRRVKQ